MNHDLVYDHDLALTEYVAHTMNGDWRGICHKSVHIYRSYKNTIAVSDLISELELELAGVFNLWWII